MLYTIVRHRREFPLLHLVAMVSNGKTQNNTPKIRQALWAVYALVIVLANWGVLPIYMYIYIYIYVHIHFQSQRRHFLPKGDRYCACLLPLPTHIWYGRCAAKYSSYLACSHRVVLHQKRTHPCWAILASTC